MYLGILVKASVREKQACKRMCTSFVNYQSPSKLLWISRQPFTCCYQMRKEQLPWQLLYLILHCATSKTKTCSQERVVETMWVLHFHRQCPQGHQNRLIKLSQFSIRQKRNAFSLYEMQWQRGRGYILVHIRTIKVVGRILFCFPLICKRRNYSSDSSGDSCYNT